MERDPKEQEKRSKDLSLTDKVRHFGLAHSEGAHRRWGIPRADLPRHTTADVFRRAGHRIVAVLGGRLGMRSTRTRDLRSNVLVW